MIPVIREPLEFYHLVPDNISLTNDGIVSLEYFYINDKRLYSKYTDKYRDRLVNEWNIYPNRDKESLSIEEIHDGINKFRDDSIDGNNRIYLFRYLPYRDLGINMSKLLDSKRAFKIDIESSNSRQYIKRIDWGYWMNDSRNRRLNRHYYINVDKDDYFKYYDDNDSMSFRTLNHIAIIPKNNRLPLRLWEEVDIE